VTNQGLPGGAVVGFICAGAAVVGLIVVVLITANQIDQLTTERDAANAQVEVLLQHCHTETSP
jgi:riboflavin synthase